MGKYGSVKTRRLAYITQCNAILKHFQGSYDLYDFVKVCNCFKDKGSSIDLILINIKNSCKITLSNIILKRASVSIWSIACHKLLC